MAFIDGKTGYIDKTGKIVVDPQFERVYGMDGCFHEGLALVSLDRKYGYIDRTGKLVINTQFDDARPFSEGLANVWIAGKAYGCWDCLGRARCRFAPRWRRPPWLRRWRRPKSEGHRPG